MFSGANTLLFILLVLYRYSVDFAIIHLYNNTVEQMPGVIHKWDRSRH